MVLTREPGGTPEGEQLRDVLLHQGHLAPRAEALLFAADRAHHVATVIQPALDRGAIVVTDRYVDSSVAYQGAGRDLGSDEVAQLSRWATAGLVPDLTVVLDLPPELARARRGQGPDRLEAEPDDFHDRVRERFLELARSEPRRYLVVNAASVPAHVQEQVRERLAPMVPESPLMRAERERREAEEQARQAEEQRQAEEAARRQAAEEAARREAEEAARRQAEEDAARQEAARRQAEEDAARREAARRQAEETARRLAEEETARRQAEVQARQAAEESARRAAAELAARAAAAREQTHRAPAAAPTEQLTVPGAAGAPPAASPTSRTPAGHYPADAGAGRPQEPTDGAAADGRPPRRGDLLPR